MARSLSPFAANIETIVSAEVKVTKKAISTTIIAGRRPVEKSQVSEISVWYEELSGYTVVFKNGAHIKTLTIIIDPTKGQLSAGALVFEVFPRI